MMTQIGLSVQVFSEKKLTVADVVVNVIWYGTESGGIGAVA
ncbi:MAG: hypothetical protein R3E08_02395 [Thiotrichaceae bacterium]